MNGQTHQLGSGDPDVEVVIHRPGLLPRLWMNPSLAFGQAYMRGDVEVRGQLMDLLKGAYQNMLNARAGRARPLLAPPLPDGWMRRREIANAQHHYDIGNTFYQLWLDKSLTYSCACFLRETDDLATAQRQKLEMLCRKARLEPGHHLLDIGCGWGSLLLHAVHHHGVKATGVTPAHEQVQHIRDQARREGVEDRVQVIHGDWRDLTGSYDRIVSVGMFEHVGRANYRPFLERWRALLNEGGLSVLHTIGRMVPRRPDPWIRRYIFPGGYLPTLEQITNTAAQTGLWVVDLENLRSHYARTLACWSANYQLVWDEVESMYDEQFARMWWLYLQGSEAGFRWGGLHLWQVVLAKDEIAPWPLDREIRLLGN